MGNLQFKRGLKSNLPASAPSGMPLWCTDTKELYIGTETGVEKVGNDASESGNANIDINIVTNVSSDSTDDEIPSAKCVYDLIGNIENLLRSV